VLALTHLGVPWSAALGAVTLKALLAWGPAVIFGGGCLMLARRRCLGEPAATHESGPLAILDPVPAL
jgi:hypothetical protein